MKFAKNLQARALTAIALIALAVLVAPTHAVAQGAAGGPTISLASNGSTVWLFDAPTLPVSTLEQLESGLEEALTGDRGKHVFGERALAEYVKTKRPAAPACLYGQGPCVSAESFAFDALDVSLVIRVMVRKSGGSFEASYELVDRRGQPSPARIVQAANARGLAFGLVREIYNATGTVSFTTNPPGARVVVDGAQIGVTPMEHRLPIGRHAFTMQLPEHQIFEGSFEVSGKDPTRVDIGLMLMPGTLLVEQTPPGALVYVDGIAEPFDANQPVELPPGDYTFQIRAQGYESTADRVRIEPGLSARRVADLRELNPLLRDISRDAIAYNRYTFRVSAEQSFQSTSFRGARTTIDDKDLFFRQFTLEDGESGSDPRRFFAARGLRFDLGYNWDNFGLGLLSIAYLRDTDRSYAAIVEDLATGDLIPAEVTQVSRLQVRPFQLNYRYFYRNVVPTAELGLGINFQRVAMRDLNVGDDAPVYSLRQTEAFWTLELGVQYFITPNWFALARYNFRDHFNLGVGTEHSIGIGIGGAFPNLFGFEPEPPEKL